MTKSLRMLVLAHGGNSAFGFLRNLVAARLLGVEDFGIAASFAIVLAAIEAITTIGLAQYLLRASDGNQPRLLQALHGIQIIRGLIGASIVAAFVPWIGAFLSIEAHMAELYALSLVPLLGGFQNLEMIRAQRDGDYSPLAKAQVTAGLASFLGLIIGTYVFADTRAVVLALLLQSAALLISSHVVANGRYKARLSIPCAAGVLKFGLPLLLNGLLLFAVLHGEKLIIARLGSLELLGVFALGLTLSLVPANVIDKALQAYVLPQLSVAKSYPDTFRERMSHTAGISAALASGILLCLTAFAPLSTVVFGQGFAPLAVLLPGFGCLAAMRILRSGIVTTAMAQGHTILAPLSNLPRVLGLSATAYVLSRGAGFELVVMIAIASEAIGLLLSVLLLRTLVGLNPAPFIFPIGVVALTCALLFAVPSAWPLIALVTTTYVWRLHSKRRPAQAENGFELEEASKRLAAT